MAHADSWVGAPTPAGFTVVATLTGASSATLHVSAQQTLAGAATFPMSNTYGDVWKADATGLTPGTHYWWGFSENGGSPVQVGSARTAPAGAGSFSFWTSTCADTGSSHSVFSAILGHDPDFGLHGGDLHYQDIKVNDPALFHDAYDQVLASPGQSNLYQNTPLIYVWDDHDYGPNNSAYNSPSRPAAVASYRQRVPHLPLPHSEGVWHTFSYGRVRFVMLDVRSMRGKEPGSMLSAEQLQWFKDTMNEATEPVAVIFTGVPWLSNHADAWGYAPAERQHIGEWLVANGWQGRVILWAGDAHSISYDDGTHNVYGGLGAPIFQTAALDQRPSDKGGTYTRPPVLNRGQYGLWQVSDDGDQIAVSMSAYTNATTLLYTETVTFDAPGGVVTPPDPDPPTASGLLRTNSDPVTLARTNGDPVTLI